MSRPTFFDYSSSFPSIVPTLVPDRAAFPSFLPSVVTADGSGEAGAVDGLATIPTLVPSVASPNDKNDDSTESGGTATGEVDVAATVYAIGDVPYTRSAAVSLTYQMQNLPSSGDFLIHVGDIRNGTSSDTSCRESEYSDVADILRLSPIPVFIVVGDNDWPDCDNAEQGLQYWKDSFLNFHDKWDHSFEITYQSDIEENFAFRYKGTLYIFLNLVGRAVMSKDAWSSRLASEVDWVQTLIREYQQDTLPRMGRIMLVSHPDPDSAQADFFDPMESFISDELDNSIPILYLNGDGHKWKYQPDYLGQSSFLRIMVRGEAVQPPLKFTLDANDKSLVLADPEEAFPYDRDLDNTDWWNSAN